MAYEMREGSGTLFRNKRKEKETHPDMNGSFLLNGQVYTIAGWTKEGQNSGKYLSLSIKAKEEDEPRNVQASEPKGRIEDMDDSIPF